MGPVLDNAAEPCETVAYGPIRCFAMVVSYCGPDYLDVKYRLISMSLIVQGHPHKSLSKWRLLDTRKASIENFADLQEADLKSMYSSDCGKPCLIKILELKPCASSLPQASHGVARPEASAH